MGKMGKLAEPKTRAINKLIFDEAKSVFGGVPDHYYIGVEKFSGGKWVYSSSGQLLSSSVWRNDQPNDDGSCVRIGSSVCSPSDIWCDGDCSRSGFSVCEF